MSKQAIVLIGMPGSMKSTLAKQFQDKGWGVISTDYIRQKLWGDENVQGDWALIEREMDSFLALGEPNVVIDATHFRAKFRRNTCEKLQSFGYHAISGLFLDEPLRQCLERNSLRDRVVPHPEIAHMADVLKQNPP